MPATADAASSGHGPGFPPDASFAAPASDTDAAGTAALPCALLLEPYPTSPGRNTLQLTRVCFAHGMPGSAQLVVELDRDSMAGVHAVGCIAQRRYLAFETGPVIDLDARSVIMDWKRGAGFVGCEEQRLILRRWQPSADLEEFDFHTRAASRVDDASPWRVVLEKGVSDGVLSPDKRSFAYMSRSKTGASDALFVVARGAPARQIATGFSFAIGPLASPYSPSTPFVWVDANRIVTQRSNGVLVVVHLDGKVEPLANVRVQTTGAMQPSLQRDASGRVVYHAGSSWLVDPDARRVSPLESVALGHEFELAPVDPGRDKPLSVRYRGREVGSHRCDPGSAKTTGGGIALKCSGRPGDAVHELFVWNARSGAWSTMEVGPRVAIEWAGEF